MTNLAIKLDPVEKRLLKMYSNSVEAGFPSPADDYLEAPIDLNELLIKKPSATYLVRVSGDSMLGAGIFPGSILIVDRSMTIRNGLICVARVDDEFTVKRYLNTGSRVELHPENPSFKPIVIGKDTDFEIQGVVRGIITIPL